MLLETGTSDLPAARLVSDLPEYQRFLPEFMARSRSGQHSIECRLKQVKYSTAASVPNTASEVLLSLLWQKVGVQSPQQALGP